jgi:hypothetical protein
VREEAEITEDAGEDECEVGLIRETVELGSRGASIGVEATPIEERGDETVFPDIGSGRGFW